MFPRCGLRQQQLTSATSEPTQPNRQPSPNSQRLATGEATSARHAHHSRQRPPPRSPFLATGEKTPHASPMAKQPLPATSASQKHHRPPQPHGHNQQPLTTPHQPKPPDNQPS